MIIKSTFKKAMWYMMVIVIPIVFGVWLIADEAVLLAGLEYATATPVLQLLIFGLIPIFLDFPVGSLLNAANRQTTKTAIIGLTMIISVVMNIILVPRIGLMGAATSAIVSYSFMFGVGLFFIKQIIPSFSFMDLFNILGRILISGLGMLFLGFLAKPYLGWIGLIPFAGVVYLIFLFLTGSIKKEDYLSFKKIFAKTVI